VKRSWKIFWTLAIGLPLIAFVVWGLWDNTRLFVVTFLNGMTLASLYFIVAAGFTLVFGLMRNVNLAHGSLYLLGGYLGFLVAQHTGWFVLALAAGFAGAALVGLLMQVSVFRFMPGEDLRQTLVTIALSIIIADLLLWWLGGTVHQADAPELLSGRCATFRSSRLTRSTASRCCRSASPLASHCGCSSTVRASA